MTGHGTAAALLAAAGLLLCACLLGNLFILDTICRRRPASSWALPTNELIIGSLALVNVLTGVFNFLWLVVYLLGLCQHTGGWVYQLLDFSGMTTGSAGFWFTACLSTFYSIKISSFGRPCLTRLKLRMPDLMPRLLLFLLLACSTLSAPTIVYIKLKPANGSDLHCGDYYETLGSYQIYITFFTALGYLVPLGVQAACSLFLVVLLCRHTRRMGAHLAGPRAAVHLRVAKMVLWLLAFYALCVVLVQVSDELYVASGATGEWFITFSFSLLAYSTGCPLALMWGTVWLHHRLLEICGRAGCCRAAVLQGSSAAASPTSPEDAVSCSPYDGVSIFVMAADFKAQD